MINEDYDISITGIQSIIDGEDDEISINTVGSYTKQGGARYITYNEYDPELPSSIHTSTLKVEPDCVTLISEQSNTRLILERGKRHRCCYDTGFGTLAMGVFTSTLLCDLKENGGRLNVKYTLDIDSVLSSCNEITVDVRRRGQVL